MHLAFYVNGTRISSNLMMYFHFIFRFPLKRLLVQGHLILWWSNYVLWCFWCSNLWFKN